MWINYNKNIGDASDPYHYAKTYILQNMISAEPHDYGMININGR